MQLSQKDQNDLKDKRTQFIVLLSFKSFWSFWSLSFCPLLSVFFLMVLLEQIGSIFFRVSFILLLFSLPFSIIFSIFLCGVNIFKKNIPKYTFTP